MISPLFDAHAHRGSRRELEERCREGITSLISTTSQEEFEAVTACHCPLLIPTFGIHPMHAQHFGKENSEEVKLLLDRSSIIGEIGMDNIWCRVPLPVQEKVFRAQLDYACRAEKPVILHTKGQEENIAAIIKEYPNTYLVHWYSAPEVPKAFMDLDCYFSIGPDIWWNPAVRQTASLVSPGRLLIETDGMDAVKWAYEEQPCPPGGQRQMPPGSVKASLQYTLHHLALILGKSEEQTAALIEKNFFAFIRKDAVRG